MWVLILILYIDGSNITSIEIPNRATKSSCINEGQRRKMTLEAEDKSMSVIYRCFKKK